MHSGSAKEKLNIANILGKPHIPVNNILIVLFIFQIKSQYNNIKCKWLINYDLLKVELQSYTLKSLGITKQEIFKKACQQQVRKYIKWIIEPSLCTCILNGLRGKEIYEDMAFMINVFHWLDTVKNKIACFKSEKFSVSDDDRSIH